MSGSKSGSPACCWALSSAYIERLSRERWTLRSFYCSHAELTDFFHTPNIVFFHPGNHEAGLLGGLRQYDRVVCNVGDPLTLKDADRQVEKTRAFSRLSQDFHNVVGGIVDDFSTAVAEGRMPVEMMEQTLAALKSRNASLQLQAVVYTMHFQIDLSPYLPFIDLINLWVWKGSDLRNLDAYVQEAARLFPGKPITLGLYLYDYGETCDTLPLDLVRFQFTRAAAYLEGGLIEGIHVLGSYLREELRTQQAQWVADFLADMG